MRLKLRGLLYSFIGLIWFSVTIALLAQFIMKYLNDDAIGNNVFYIAGSVLVIFTICIIILAPIIYLVDDYATRDVRSRL